MVSHPLAAILGKVLYICRRQVFQAGCLPCKRRNNNSSFLHPPSEVLRTQLPVSLYSRLRPFLGYEPPVVEFAWNDDAAALNLLGEIVALVALTAIDDATLKRILGYASTTSEQLAAAITSVTVEHHLIPFLLVKGLTI